MSTEINDFDTIYAPPDSAIDDSGSEFSSIQAAIDNASSWVLVGPGTFEESVDINTSDFDLIGSGRATKIDATDEVDNAFYTDVKDVTLRNISVTGDPNENTAAVEFGPSDDSAGRGVVENIVITDSGGNGVELNQINSRATSVTVEGASTHGVKLFGSGVIVSDLFIDDVDEWAVDVDSEFVSVGSVVARGPVENGIRLQSPRCLVAGVNIRNPGTDGIEIQGDDCVLGNAIVDQAGGDAVTLSGTDIQLANVLTMNTSVTALNDGGATDTTYANVIADGTVEDNISSPTTDSDYISRLVDSPNASIANAVLDDGDSAEVSVPVPDQETLKVYFWGAWKISDGSTPTDLDVELKDGSDTVKATENTGGSESVDPASPVASHQNTTGSTSIYKLALANDTGSTISDPGVGGVFAYVVE